MLIVAIIILLIVGFVVAFLVGVPIAGLAVYSQRWAKKQAHHMINTGKIDWKNFDRVSKILATTKDDLEAADLWHRLQELHGKQMNAKPIS